MKKILIKFKLIEDYSKAQGIVESVVAVGILMMVLTGTVLLVSFGLSNRKTGFDRRKANELATLIMEEKVSQSISDPESFWLFTDISDPQSKTGYDGYSYTVKLSEIDKVGCDSTINDCALLVVNIGWSGKDTQNLKFERFFSR
ncbi:MAG TPA: hypothetical protein PK045_02405 [Candidatus Woesebacteria bacterium]|nr:hypothetical protein [Candidatus Shapirobacteria bacterium]HOY61334.1 hypothetical protein [Candidatus Woesebacteria bacterium]